MAACCTAPRATRLTAPSAHASVAACLIGILAACAGDDVPGPPDLLPETCPSDLPSDADCPGVAPSYTETIAGIIEQRCNGCHYAQNPFSSQVLADYERLFAARRTALSRIYGCRMPPADAPALSPSERAALLQWFVCGAPQN